MRMLAHIEDHPILSGLSAVGGMIVMLGLKWLILRQIRKKSRTGNFFEGLSDVLLVRMDQSQVVSLSRAFCCAVLLSFIVPNVGVLLPNSTASALLARLAALLPAVIYIGACVHLIPAVRKFSEAWAVRLTGGALLSLLVWVGHIQASTLLESVFDVPASAMPNALFMGTALWAAYDIGEILKWVVQFIGLPLGALGMLVVNGGPQKMDAPVLIFFAGLFCAGTLGLATKPFSDQAARRAIIEEAALRYDFAPPTLCTAAAAQTRVLYLGSGLDRALVVLPLVSYTWVDLINGRKGIKYSQPLLLGLQSCK